MRQDKITTKLQEALSDAQSLAVGNDNQYIEPVHLLTALLNQDGGGARALLARAGVNVGGMTSALRSAFERLPKVSGTGGETQIGRELMAVLNLADKEAQKRGDQFIASEMVLLALTEDKSDAGKLAREAGLSRKALESANGVIGEITDQSAGEGRQRLVVRRPQQHVGLPERLERIGRRRRQGVAEPQGPAVTFGEDPRAAHPHEAVTGPLPALFGGLEQKRAGPAAGQLAIDPHRGLPVREQTARHRHQRLGQLSKLLTARGGDPEGRGTRAQGLTPTMTGSATRSKQLRSPVWQAPPTWSTRTSKLSPSQSSATDLTHCWEPDVSPLTQYS